MDYLQYIENIKSIDDCQLYNFPNYPVDQMHKVFEKWLEYLFNTIFEYCQAKYKKS